MSVKRFFCKKKPKPLVGDRVPVIGEDDLMYMYINKLSSPEIYPPGICLRGQAEHNAIKFHVVGVQLGARCAYRHLWKEYVADAKTFICILPGALFEETDYFDYLFCIPKAQMQELVSLHDSDKNILFLFENATDEEVEKRASKPLRSEIKEWLDEFQKRHTVAHFSVCLTTGRGMDEALDWLVGHLTAPPEPSADEKKSRSPFHWLAEVGKKALLVGTSPKTPRET